MIVRITARRQITLPATVLEAMGVGPGDRLRLEVGSDGLALKLIALIIRCWER